jgi:hypothetical protein
MALFSRRFWHSVIGLDRRVAAAVANCDIAMARFRISRTLVSHQAHSEYHMELCEALAELRVALNELRAFQERNSTYSPKIERCS